MLHAEHRVLLQRGPLQRLQPRPFAMAQGRACTSSRCGRSSAARCAINRRRATKTRYTAGGRKSPKYSVPRHECLSAPMACCAGGSGGPVEYREYPQHPSRSASECRGVRRCGVHSRWRAAVRLPTGESFSARRLSVSTRRVPQPVGYPVPCLAGRRGGRSGLPARRAAAVPRHSHPDESVGSSAWRPAAAWHGCHWPSPIAT